MPCRPKSRIVVAKRQALLLKHSRPQIALTAIIFLATSAVAEESATENPAGFSYGKKGFQYDSGDGRNFLWFGVRLQSRYSNSLNEVLSEPGQPSSRSEDLSLNRGRLKLGGHLFTPRFAVYSEYDFTKDNLLDLRATYEFAPWLSLRAGQWKSEFNRERVDSSGAQQFVERSVATPFFTIDRQQGVMASGRIAAGRQFDSSFWFGRLSGAGRGGNLSKAEGLWMGRWQWNVTRRVLGFSQSDLGRRDAAAGSIAVAAVTGESRYTSFSGAGGGQLPGYAEGSSDRYRIRQVMLETAWQYHGFSWQQEYHRKEITDRVTNSEQKFRGGYAQAGMFFSELWQQFPRPLELALRYAEVRAGELSNELVERESTVAANWFFAGHRNKLTVDASHLRQSELMRTSKETRIRLQWDVSF
jgi:phosphate-selective porin